MADMMDIILAKALSGNGSGGGTGEGDPALDRRVTALEEELDTLLDENGNVLKEKLPLLEMAEVVAGMVLDEDGKISEDLLPEDWVKGYVEEYINEALGGEY